MRGSTGLCVALVALVCLGGQAGAATITIAGPTLTNSTSGWGGSGMQFTAQQDLTLLSFTYENLGAAGNVYLTDTSGTTLQTYAAPAGDTTHSASVSWALSAGTTYRLISENDGRYAFYTSYPTTNAHLSVAGVWGFSNLNTGLWMFFTDLTTTDEVEIPEPATLALLAAGAFGLLGARARRRR